MLGILPWFLGLGRFFESRWKIAGILGIGIGLVGIHYEMIPHVNRFLDSTTSEIPFYKALLLGVKVLPAIVMIIFLPKLLKAERRVRDTV